MGNAILFWNVPECTKWTILQRNGLTGPYAMNNFVKLQSLLKCLDCAWAEGKEQGQTMKHVQSKPQLQSNFL